MGGEWGERDGGKRLQKSYEQNGMWQISQIQFNVIPSSLFGEGVWMNDAIKINTINCKGDDDVGIIFVINPTDDDTPK